jgi:LEA14-like dessication related protein
MKTFISTLALFLIILSSCSSSKNVQTPEFLDVNNVRLIKVGVLQTTAGVDMVFYNPNDFAIQLTNARGDVYIDNAYLGRFDLDQKVQVRKHAEFVLPVTFKLDNVGAMINQRDIFKRKEAVVKIEGIARIKKSGFSKDIPITYQHLQNIEQLRELVTR